MRYRPFGDFVKIVDLRNSKEEVANVLGINIQKQFMPSIANLSATDISKYKIIKKGQFAYSAMQVGRDETIRIALYDKDEPSIISPAYLVLQVKDETEILPEYLMMNFLRAENDRLGWFISDGSVRASLDFDRLGEIEIPYISIEEQKKYVDLYNALQKNQKCYEDSLEDLQLICDAYIENLIKSEPKKLLGEYIEQCEERNNNLACANVLGISVSKKFIPTKAQTEDLNLSNYKIVKENEFSFVSVTSRNGEKISIAILKGKTGIVSSTYTVFKVKENVELLPEFLFLWFTRPEFDRYARFHSWGSARETFNWEDMCNVKLPIPDIEKQKAIVTIYHTLETRKQLSEELKSAMKPLCPVLMKKVRDMITEN